MRIGLNDEEVKESIKKYGKNIISTKSKNSFGRLLIESLGDPIIKILLIALAIKVVFLFKNFDWYETIGILIAIFLASFISSISEYGSNKAFERLIEESQMLKCKVYRNNKIENIMIKDIVVGDVLSIQSGDKMPVDGYLLKGSIEVDESSITGESKEIIKKDNAKVFGGTTVYKGNALVKVTDIGDKTYMGKISNEVQSKNEESPLKNKLRILAGQISKLGYIGAFLASIAYLFYQIVIINNFNPDLILNTLKDYHLILDYLIYALTLCVTIIIMAVPEGLPMMITLVLSSNMKKMLKDNVLVRKLVGIETSGSLNVLFCDKTGTLTEGKLIVNKIVSYDELIFDDLESIASFSKYQNILIDSLMLNNESTYNGKEIIGGNTTDKAIMSFVKNMYYKKKFINQVLFDSKNKYSSITLENNLTYFKGAAEVLLNKCTKYLNKYGEEKYLLDKDKINKIIDKYTSEGYRVLLNAYQNKNNYLVFISLIVLSDRVRNNAKNSIKEIKNAGIKVVMLTGDSKKTALNIAKELGIYEDGDFVYTHDDLNTLDENIIKKNYSKISVIARSLPEDKLKLVKLYKNNNLVVGMTGDGVNDALALKKSDVGFSLGSGSEVAKEASDIVLLDDNISSITNSILYGRTIFKSIRKFVVYQLTVNICALILSIVGIFLNVETPITIIQMLWLNMIMDTFAGLAFSFEPPLKEYMKESPKNKNEKIINKYMYNEIIFNGLYSVILLVLFLKLPSIRRLYNFSTDNRYLMTAFFALFIFLGIINSFLARSQKINFLKNITKNKVFLIINIFIFTVQIYIIYYGGSIFRTYGLTLKELLITLFLSLSIIPFDFLRKIIYLNKNKEINI